jgi:hypothetical protein
MKCAVISLVRCSLPPCLLVSLSLCFLLPPHAAADGGAIRLSQQSDAYQITVFTSPTPLRAGLVDVSVLVLDRTKGRPVQDAEVIVRAARPGNRGESYSTLATSEVATNKLLQAAVFELPEAGQWTIEVLVKSPLIQTQVQIDVDLAEPAPRWVSLWPWIGWPGLVIVFFGVNQYLVRRRLR